MPDGIKQVLWWRRQVGMDSRADDDDDGGPPATMKAYVENPDLDEVKPEDRNLIKDVVSMLSSIQHPNRLCKGWSVKPRGTTHYDVVGHIDTKNKDWAVYYDDLDLIRRLDYARVGGVSVRVSGPLSAEIYVRVTSQSERVMVTECDIIRVHKRTRWFG
jgi:hypothetical protein